MRKGIYTSSKGLTKQDVKMDKNNDKERYVRDTSTHGISKRLTFNPAIIIQT